VRRSMSGESIDRARPPALERFRGVVPGGHGRGGWSAGMASSDRTARLTVRPISVDAPGSGAGREDAMGLGVDCTCGTYGPPLRGGMRCDGALHGTQTCRGAPGMQAGRPTSPLCEAASSRRMEAG